MSNDFFTFDEQYRRGEPVERAVCEAVSDRFCTLAVPERLQRAPYHMDAIWIEHRTPHRVFSVEITADWKAADTGNVLVEVHSVEEEGAPGKYWATWANLAVHTIPSEGVGYICRIQDLQDQMLGWERDYPTKRIPNDGYTTVGSAVPRPEIESISLHELRFDPLRQVA